MQVRSTRRPARARRRRTTGGALLAAIAVSALVACSAESDAPQAASPGAAAPAGTQTATAEAPADPGRLAARGEQVYRTNCIACHAMDPGEAGAVGPAIAGSSLELLRAKVLRNEYPPGYTPKRETRAMVPLPHLEPDLPALAAYLGQAAD